MDNPQARVSRIHSLKTRMCLGTILLLALTLASISYSLIIHEKRILTNEIERAVTLQSRNIALSSEKALLRSDPEFELCPLVKRIIDKSSNVLSVVITDSRGITQGATELQSIGKEFKYNLRNYEDVKSEFVGSDETLYQNNHSYFLIVPVRSQNKDIGKVHFTYSKSEFHRSIRHAITITLICSAVVFLLGISLSLLLFRQLSRPIDILLRGVHNFGAGDLDSRIELTTKNELSILASSFNDMASRILKAQKELVIKERIQRELEIASDIQSTLIPEHIYEPEGYQIGHHYKSATEVGGDYLDVIPIDNSRLALVMADVSGKGVPGLVVMAMVKILAQEFVSKLAPIDVIRRLNELLRKTIQKNMFVTFFVGVLNTDRQEFTFSNAGHNPLLIYRQSDRSSRFLKLKGPPLGIFPDDVLSGKLRDYSVILESGDLVLQYTDGLNESMNQMGVLFNYERILHICTDYAELGARSVVSKLVEAESEFRMDHPQTDDITILGLSSCVQKSVRKQEMEV